MIAQIVFDLPLDGPFDYLIPEHLNPQITAGSLVKVSFGPRTQTGFVIGLIEKSAIAKLKPVLSLSETSAVFNDLDITFAKEFCDYYGCSLGEALGAMYRNREDHKPSVRRDHQPQYLLYRCQPDHYAVKVREIIDGYRKIYQDTAGDYCHFLILVPDSFRAQTLSQELNSLPPGGRVREGGSIKIGARSSVFECDGRFDCVIMVDEEDSSFKQEQTPMYETRQVLLSRSGLFGFDIAWVGVSPSVELMALVEEKKIKLIEEPKISLPAVKLVDLTNYKYVPGLISPPVKDALEAVLKAGKKGILILNRKGSYRLTRCVDCAVILKCDHCDSALTYSRSESNFQCRHCTFKAPGDIVCPKCHKPSWASQGIGVEQIQTELKKLFPQAKIISFERDTKKKTRPVQGGETLADFNILISTSAVLRFQGQWQVSMATFIDFDAELNRIDMRSSFNAFSLASHVRGMALDTVLIQTRNSGHYVLQNFVRGKIKEFYDEEFKLRKEFGFSPFKHWVKISWRGKLEKIVRQAAQQAYEALCKSPLKGITITPPLADAVGRKRDQFRFNVMVQADQVPQAVFYIKSTLNKIKRPSRVIMTFNIDP